jgi:hypothetical protein
MTAPATATRAPLTPVEREVQYLVMRRKLDLAALEGGPAALGAHLDPVGYVRRAHTDKISQAYLDIRAGVVDRVSISLPPQSGKSRTAAGWAVFWWLVHNKTHRVVIASYGDSLAMEHGIFVREMIRAYGRRYGLILDPRRQAAHNWRLLSGGGVRSVGMRTALTGHPVEGLLVIDDMHKDRQEADSKRVRNRVGDWYSSTAYTRLAPGTAIVMIGTRWHPDDLIGRVTAYEPKRWRQIIMPALCSDPATDPLGRAAGAPLPHPRIPADDTAAALRHWEDMRVGMTPRDWGALAMCDPKLARDPLVTWQQLKDARNFTWDAADSVKAGVAVDPNGGGRDQAGIVGGHIGTDERLHVTHDWSGNMQPGAWGRKACELAVEIDADVIFIETNYGGKQATTIVRQAWESLRREELDAIRENPATPRVYTKRLCPRIKSVTARKNKRLRADPVAMAIIEGYMELCARMPELEQEWATWEEESGFSPGRIDASVYLATGMLKVPGQRKGASATGTSQTTVASRARKRGGGALSATGYRG